MLNTLIKFAVVMFKKLWTSKFLNVTTTNGGIRNVEQTNFPSLEGEEYDLLEGERGEV